MDRTRRQQALDLRIAAAQLASRHATRPVISDIAAIGDEALYRGQHYLMSFSKGLPHDVHSGLLRDPRHYEMLRAAITAENAGALNAIDTLRQSPRWQADNTLRADSLRKVPVRHWDGMHAGSEFQLLGPDAQALTITPAPALGSAAMTAEMAELYAMALLRDVPLRQLGSIDSDVADDNTGALETQRQRATEIRRNLSRLAQSADLFRTGDISQTLDDSTGQSALLRALHAQSLLHQRERQHGAYLSQFLLCGTADVHAMHSPGDGVIVGSDRCIDQRIRRAAKKDYATTWNEWLDLQHGADLRMLEKLPSAMRSNDLRFIVTPRDLAARVRHTTPQQFFFNACLILQAANARRNDDMTATTIAHDMLELQGDEFASHRLVALLAQAASSAINAARFQQFHIHRRLRPEALAARLEKFDHPDVAMPALTAMHADLTAAHLFDDCGRLPARANRLLPLAWIEGAPMAPSYCSAYAAAAGACATVVKAVFNGDGDRVIDPGHHGADIALLPDDDGRQLLPVKLQQPLTLAGEIDKLAANLAIGRCWAGVSFHSDVAAGLHLGERVALCLLDEMRLSRKAWRFVTP